MVCVREEGSMRRRCEQDGDGRKGKNGGKEQTTMTGAEGARRGGLTGRWAVVRPKTLVSVPCSERNESNCAKLAGSSGGRTRRGISVLSLPGKSVVCGIMPHACTPVHRYTFTRTHTLEKGRKREGVGMEKKVSRATTAASRKERFGKGKGTKPQSELLH